MEFRHEMEILGRCCFLGPRALKESTKKTLKELHSFGISYTSAASEGFNYHTIMVLVFQNGLEGRPPSTHESPQKSVHEEVFLRVEGIPLAHKTSLQM